MKKERIKQEDYQNENRPKTRSKQFLDIFKHRFVELLKLSLLQTVFNMPLIVSFVIFYALIRNTEDLNALMTVFLIQGVSFLISMPCSYAGMTGTFYCMKKLGYAEGEFASSSFFIGLREEWKKGLLIGLIVGLSACVAVIGFFFLYFYFAQIDVNMTGFGIAVLGIQLIVILMVSYYSIAQIVIYDNSMRFILKNSFIFTLMRFHHNLVCFIFYPAIIIALICIMEITMFVAVGLIVFFAAFGHLLWMMNALAAFDKFINKTNYPDYYRKGLYKQDEQEA